MPARPPSVAPRSAQKAPGPRTWSERVPQSKTQTLSKDPKGSKPGSSCRPDTGPGPPWAGPSGPGAEIPEAAASRAGRVVRKPGAVHMVAGRVVRKPEAARRVVTGREAQTVGARAPRKVAAGRVEEPGKRIVRTVAGRVAHKPGAARTVGGLPRRRD